MTGQPSPPANGGCSASKQAMVIGTYARLAELSVPWYICIEGVASPR
jgi:hypothetical protein